MDREVESRCQFIDRLVYNGSPYAKPLVNGFSVFPVDSPLNNLMDSKNLEHLAHNKSIVQDSDSFTELQDKKVLLEKEIEKLEKGNESLGVLCPVSVSRLEELLKNFSTTIKNFNQFCQSQAQLRDTAAVDRIETTTRELPYNSELGPMASRLFSSLKEYHQYMEAIQKVKQDFDRLHSFEKNVNRGDGNHETPSNMIERLSSSLEEARILQTKMESIYQLISES